MINVVVGVLPGRLIRLSVAGEIDMATVGELADPMTAAVERADVTGLIVDFAGVTFCDSVGIAALDRAYAAAGRRAIPFRLVNVQPGVRRMLELVGLFEALTADRSA
jgi:anti-anti-sigma factor